MVWWRFLAENKVVEGGGQVWHVWWRGSKQKAIAIDFRLVITRICMAYALGFSKDVTALIYSMRDGRNWNGDKFRSTPLGRLFTGSAPQCTLDRDPESPCFVGRGQEEGVYAEVEKLSSVSPYDNVALYKQDPEHPWCYDEVAVLRLAECWADLAKPADFFSCEPCLPNNEMPGEETMCSCGVRAGAILHNRQVQSFMLASAAPSPSDRLESRLP